MKECKECPIKKAIIEETYLKSFLKKLKRKFKTTSFKVKYSEDTDVYFIIHNNEFLDNNKNFARLVGSILKDFNLKERQKGLIFF